MKLNLNELFFYVALIKKEENIYKIINRSKKHTFDIFNEEIVVESHPIYNFIKEAEIHKNYLKEINNTTFFCIKYRNNYFIFGIDTNRKKELLSKIELGQKLLDHKSVILFEGEIGPTNKIKILTIDNNIEKIIPIVDIENKYLEDVFETRESLYVYDGRYFFYIQTIEVGPNKVIGCLININEKEFFKDIDYIAFRNLLDNLNESIVILDLSHHVVYANTKAHILFGKNLNEHKSKWDYKNCIDENKNTITFRERIYYKAVLNKQDILNKTIGYRIGDNGDIIWLLCSSRLLYDEFKNIKGTINSYLDITIEKQNGDQIKELLVKLETHNVNSPLGLIEFDEHLNIKTWNWKVEELFKFKSREIINKNINDINIIHEDSYYYFYEAFEDLIKGKDLRNIISIKNYNKDRQIIYCKWFNSVININHKKSIISYLLDISNEIELQEKNKETEDRLKTIINLIPDRNLDSKVVSQLISNPLTENTNEKNIRAEILLRQLEEDVKKINTTLYHNGKSVVTRLAIVEQNQGEDRLEFSSIKRKLEVIENNIQSLGNVLNFIKLFNKQNLIIVISILAVGSILFEGYLGPAVVRIIRFSKNKIELTIPDKE